MFPSDSVIYFYSLINSPEILIIIFFWSIMAGEGGGEIFFLKEGRALKSVKSQYRGNDNYKFKREK